MQKFIFFLMILSQPAIAASSVIPSSLPDKSSEATPFSTRQKLAAEGDAIAQFNMGVTYAHGLGVTKDLKLAFAWFEKAAQAGQPNAQTSLGWAYMSDYLGLPRNYTLAMAWNSKAAAQGFGEGSSNVALLYENGWGVPVNYPEAVKWYMKAANQDASSGQTALHLAGLYEYGRGVKQDLELATKLYQIVIDGDDTDLRSEAQRRLLLIQDNQKLKGLDDVQYPQEVVPKKGRPKLRHGKSSGTLSADVAALHESRTGSES